MAAGTSADDLAGKYRRLAALVEELEADGYDVVDAQPTEDDHGRQHAAIQLNLDGGLDAEPFRADDLEDAENRETASISSTCNGDESNDVDDQDEEFAVGDEIEEEESDTDDEETEGVWCGICGEGPFEMLSIHHGRVHEGDQIVLDHEPSEAELVGPDEDDQDDEPEDDDPVAVEDVPDYEGPDPEAVVAESSLSPHIVLDDVLDACVDATRASAPVVACVTDELGVRSDAVQPVLRKLGLQQEDRRMLVDDVGAQVAAIRQEVDDG